MRAPWQLKAEGVRGRAKGVMWLLGAVLLGARRRRPRLAPERAARRGQAARRRARRPGRPRWSRAASSSGRSGCSATGGCRSRRSCPGAIVGAVGLEILKLAGDRRPARLVAGSSSLYGPIGVVFAILAWLALFGRLLVYASATNAVLLRGAGRHACALEIRAPRLDDSVPLEADRGGAVKEREPTARQD